MAGMRIALLPLVACFTIDIVFHRAVDNRYGDVVVETQRSLQSKASAALRQLHAAENFLI